jgi:hypothetical protein
MNLEEIREMLKTDFKNKAEWHHERTNDDYRPDVRHIEAAEAYERLVKTVHEVPDDLLTACGDRLDDGFSASIVYQGRLDRVFHHGASTTVEFLQEFIGDWRESCSMSDADHAACEFADLVVAEGEDDNEAPNVRGGGRLMVYAHQTLRFSRRWPAFESRGGKEALPQPDRRPGKKSRSLMLVNAPTRKWRIEM